jgi:hypothetical protein
MCWATRGGRLARRHAFGCAPYAGHDGRSRRWVLNSIAAQGAPRPHTRRVRGQYPRLNESTLNRGAVAARQHNPFRRLAISSRAYLQQSECMRGLRIVKRRRYSRGPTWTEKGAAPPAVGIEHYSCEQIISIQAVLGSIPIRSTNEFNDLARSRGRAFCLTIASHNFRARGLPFTQTPRYPESYSALS